MVISTIYPSPSDPARIVPLPHSWDRPFRVSFEYQTDILTSSNGKEQRRAVRVSPRLYTEHNFVMDRLDKVAWDAYMAAWQPKPAVIGLEHLAVVLLSTMSAGSFTASVRGFEDAAFYFEPGSTVILSNGRRRETRTVATCGASSITFSDNSPVAWPADTRIMPAGIGQPDNGPNTVRVISRAGTSALRTMFAPDKQPAIPVIGEPELVGGREIFMKRLNWANGPEVQHAWDRDPVDAGFGVVAQYYANAFPTRIFKANYVGKDHTDAYEVINFFMRHYGMNREFLLPTWEDDIPFVAIAGGGLAILVEGTNFAYGYMDSTVFRRIMIRFVDGTYFHDLVDYIEPLPDTDSSVIWLKDMLPVEKMTPANIAGISWVLVSRFAIDRLDVDFLTNSVATFPISMQSLENYEV